MNSDIESEAESTWDFDQAVARLLERRRKKADQLLRFKETQRRQHRWVPLREAINWLSEINERGERCAPNEALALRRTAEIWAVMRGDDILFSKYRLGGNDLPSCLIEDAHPDNAISRFTARDLIGKINDPKKLRALLKQLWLPRRVLLLLFQEKRWPVPPGLEEPAPRPTKNITPSAMATEGLEETYLAWVADNRAKKIIPTRDDDLAHMRQKFPKIKREDIQRLRPPEWSQRGRRPKSA